MSIFQAKKQPYKAFYVVVGLFGLVLVGNAFQYVEKDLNIVVSKFPIQFNFLESNHFAYLLVMAGSVLFPFLLSFDKKVHFWTYWKYFFPAALLTALFFYPLDMLYTYYGVWGFNSDYYQWSFLGLPDGEWLFFVLVPYCCIFIYECLNAYFPKNPLDRFTALIDLVLLITFLLIGLIFYDKVYTGSKFLLSGILLYLNIFVWKTPYRSRFYFCFAVQLIPFLIVDGILTGGFTNAPIVVYNDTENLSSVFGRIVSVPFDDIAYDFLLLLMVTNWFEYFKRGGLG
jgi:lycopene cyclase domain-containing protein